MESIRNTYTPEDHREVIDITYNIKRRSDETNPRIVDLFTTSGLVPYHDASKSLRKDLTNINISEKQRDLKQKEFSRLQRELSSLLTHLLLHTNPLQYKLYTSEDLEIGKEYKFVVTTDMLGYLDAKDIVLSIGEPSTLHVKHTTSYMHDTLQKSDNSDSRWKEKLVGETLAHINTLGGGYFKKIDDVTVQFYNTSLGLGPISNSAIRIIGQALFPGYTIITEMNI